MQPSLQQRLSYDLGQSAMSYFLSHKSGYVASYVLCQAKLSYHPQIHQLALLLPFLPSAPAAVTLHFPVCHFGQDIISSRGKSEISSESKHPVKYECQL